MTSQEIVELESEFEIKFPHYYKERLRQGLGYDSDTVVCCYKSLRNLNIYPREKNVYWSLPWEDYYWIIGGDGAGGFNLLDTTSEEDIIYSFDHEDCGISLSDERVVAYALDELIEADIAIQKEIEAEEIVAEKTRRDKVLNRRWWQFWIPKSIK